MEMMNRKKNLFVGFRAGDPLSTRFTIEHEDAHQENLEKCVISR